MPATENALALSEAITTRTHQLCLGLEYGEADILELVTPTTAELLAWWFGEDMVLARGGNTGGLNFHAGQKQAILNAIVAHEVLSLGHANWTLQGLYQAAAPDALLAGTRLAEVSDPKHSHPKLKLTPFHGHFPTERESPKCPKPNHRTRQGFASKWLNWSEAVASPASCQKNLVATPQAS